MFLKNLILLSLIVFKTSQSVIEIEVSLHVFKILVVFFHSKLS